MPLPTNDNEQSDLVKVFDTLELPFNLFLNSWYRMIVLDSDTFNSQTNPWNKWYQGGNFLAQPDEGDLAGPCITSDSRLNGEWNNMICNETATVVCQANPEPGEWFSECKNTKLFSYRCYLSEWQRTFRSIMFGIRWFRYSH